MGNYSLVRRFLAGISGQAYARIAYAINTVVLVPILIGAWGLSGYGEWIALTALATYFSYSNFGMVTTSANEIVMAIGAGDQPRAQQAYQMSINVSFYIVLPIIIGFIFIFSLVPVSSVLNVTEVGQFGAISILAICGAQLWVSTLRGILVAVLYSNGSYGLAYFVSGTSKFIELIAIALIVLIWAEKQVVVAGVITGVGILDAIVIYFMARRAASWARVDFTFFDFGWIKKQIKPAIGFALSNLSMQGIVVQGPRVLLSITIGPHAAAIYSVYGTAMRLIDQLLLMVALPLEIEIARCVGRNEKEKVYSLVIMGMQVGWAVFAVVAFGFLSTGGVVFRIWTHGHITFDLSFMALFLVMAGCNQIGRINAHALIATNRMYGPSIVALVGCSVGLFFGGVASNYYGLVGMAIGIICAELFYSLVMVNVSMRWLGRSMMECIYDTCNLRMAISAVVAWVWQKVYMRKEL
ncbi:MAG: hypothetical protein Q8M24_11275 [Pseudolabrys sp.]|nr:hypothetical protein [Pseudolabrys sp.]MDP2296028.1 hypothetical protein [Pseudolabrys sp.]